MTCKFTYNTASQSEQSHCIQLRKHQEDHNILIIGRKCLHEYGHKIMKVSIAKHRNELPAYVIQKNRIDVKDLGEINDFIERIATEKFKYLSSDISSIIEEDSLELDSDDILIINKQRARLPSTPDTESSSNISDQDDRTLSIQLVKDKLKHEDKECSSVVKADLEISIHNIEEKVFCNLFMSSLIMNRMNSNVRKILEIYRSMIKLH